MLEPLVLGGVGLAEVHELERPHDALEVVGMDELRAGGVEPPELVVERLRPVLARELLPAGPALAGPPGGKVHLVDDGVEVEPRAATEDGRAALRDKPVDAAARVPLEEARGVVVPGVADVHHEERAAPLVGRGLGGPHVHAAVDLHGVDRDDG